MPRKKKNKFIKTAPKRTRRSFDDTLKTRIFLESLKEAEPLSALASRYEVHANQISLWKKQFLENASSAFSGDKEAAYEMDKIDELFTEDPIRGTRRLSASLNNRLLRALLSWRLSTTMGADFCIDTLKEALIKYGHPEIFNSDQGSQFTCDASQRVHYHNVYCRHSSLGNISPMMYLENIGLTFRRKS